MPSRRLSIWPRSLRARLILVLTLAMVATQLIVFIAVAEVFGREQRLERAQQVARIISFLRPQLEAWPTELDEGPITPQLSLTQPRAVPSVAPGDTGQAYGSPPATPPAFPLTPAMPRPALNVRVVAELPDFNMDELSEEALRVMKAAVPEVQAAQYRDLATWPGLGPRRPYLLETWVKLSSGRYLHIRFDDSRELRDEARPHVAFPFLDLLLRGGVGLALALLIAGWVSKPLARLAEEADAMFPAGRVRDKIIPQITPMDLRHEPSEIATTLAAFDRMRGRIDAMFRERSTMLTALAHDLRTPLTRLMLRLELSSEMALQADARRDCERMQMLIARTLEYLRSTEIRATDGAPLLQSVDLSIVITDVVRSLPDEERERVRVFDQVRCALPVRANYWGLERVFANLIENALKYSSDGKSIEIEIMATASQVSVAVRDDGPGVPEQALSRLREPFYRVDSAREVDSGGAGLGLSIVDNFVRAYGGELAFANLSAGGFQAKVTLDRVLVSA